ncbi:hypothetical protein [Ramlibacter alkalitolerans]|uniref:Antitoxin Xre/MbcA/ParS-like toxin-binding domain-containing protein n=1 Tax=Ramlibacter alkalitolerans TaxID=2039631 RepID=A0ABS1JU99_9BURK|nr:hypothetical protein [Ramlibacter alkalitolerans]MBL0427870.1 hypothetical protein [Ramlibacter alkalitolerans]
MLDLRDQHQLQQLLEVLEILKDESLGTKMQFLLNGRYSLGGLTPLEAIERGRLEQVKTAAQGVVEG